MVFIVIMNEIEQVSWNKVGMNFTEMGFFHRLQIIYLNPDYSRAL